MCHTCRHNPKPMLERKIKYRMLKKCYEMSNVMVLVFILFFYSFSFFIHFLFICFCFCFCFLAKNLQHEAKQKFTKIAGASKRPKSSHQAPIN